jgi:hypothetical protein
MGGKPPDRHENASLCFRGVGEASSLTVRQQPEYSGVLGPSCVF